MLNWLTSQTESIISGWSRSMEKYYPQYFLDWSKPDNHLKALSDKWNLLDAVKLLNWDELLLKKDLRILDLGCGTGWLSAFLSKNEKVKKIYALDSDETMLTIMLPKIVEGMSGDIQKITPVLGYFQPIIVEDGCLDLVVASSAIHHSPDLDGLLLEINRVLKSDGKLVILNETPWGFLSYFAYLFKTFTELIISCFFQKTNIISKTISINGILYDPRLGDYMHSYYQWDKAIKGAKFSYHTFATGLFTQKNQTGQRNKLVHFICSKN